MAKIGWTKNRPEGFALPFFAVLGLEELVFPFPLTAPIETRLLSGRTAVVKAGAGVIPFGILL